jgi:hypothetical protein
LNHLLHRSSEGRTIIHVVVACVDHALKHQVSDCGTQGVAAPGRHDGVALRSVRSKKAANSRGLDFSRRRLSARRARVRRTQNPSRHCGRCPLGRPALPAMSASPMCSQRGAPLRL